MAVVTAGGLQVAAADWPTYRGDLRRSGAADGASGPADPRVLWAVPGKNHYVAAPAPGDRRLFLGALGPFNSPLALAISAEPDKPGSVLWSVGPPALKLPLACSPVVIGEVVVFGEGMHQDATAGLTAFTAAEGLPLWRLEVSGALRHLEGSPAFAAGKLYFGAGSGGVLCVDAERVQLPGGPVPVAEAARRARAAWRVLEEKYARMKETEPDFAVPPDPSSIPAGSVEGLWTAGADRWHVDAAVAVHGERLFAGSARIDDEEIGERLLLALSTRDGSVIWQTPLPWNPWGPPSIAEAPGSPALVLAGLSSIRYDPAEIAGAKGGVIAAKVESGEVAWRLEVPGGVLAPLTISRSGALALFPCTDGAVRAVRTANGEVVWTNAGEAPLFAALALAEPRVYAADLDGGLRALDAASGREIWRLAPFAHPRVGLPGRIYAAPLVAGDRLFAASANFEGPHASAPTAVICVGEKGAGGAGEAASAGVTIDRERRRVVVEAAIAPRKLPHLDGIYPLEVIATAPDGKKAHETVLTSKARPSAIHAALESLGATAGKPGIGETPGSGPELDLLIEYEGPAGTRKRIPAGMAVVDRKTGLPLGAAARWRFTGSVLVRADPGKAEEMYGADGSGTLVTVYPVTGETVIQSVLGMEEEKLLELETAPWLPPVGSKAWLVIEVPPPSGPQAPATEGGRP